VYRSILVPLDGSEFAEQAMPVALEIAQRTRAVLHPVHVYRPEEPWRDFEAITPYRFEGVVAYEPEYEREERQEERGYLGRVAQTAVEHGAEVEPELLDGNVVDALERHAERIGADLVVMATHGRGRLSRAWLGSIADRLVRELSVPVLLVRPDDRVSTQAPALDHILIPLDGSTYAESVLDHAAELGRLWEARCTLLTVVLNSVLQSRRPFGPSGDGDGGASARLNYQTARQYLERVAERLRGRWSQLDVRVVEGDHVARAIVSNAEQLDARLIAIATHGRGGLKRLVLGSVADKVIRASTFPLLVHHPAHSSS
jgi:nucleotide-binding universal stress UspA family protein